jgi:DNA-binding MarR family transcriptional regulator
MQSHRDVKLDASACIAYLIAMTDEPCDSAVRAWTRLLRAHQSALGRVEGALKAAGLPPLAWYDVLLELERAEGGMRPYALEERLLLPQYSLSRLLARLEAAGLIERGACPGDGRGQVVAITDAGRAMRSRMWPVYGAALQKAIGAKLCAAEADILAVLLGKLVAPPAARG